MKKAIQRNHIFHPVTVLSVSILAALIFASFVMLRFEGETRWFLLYYFTPIGIPFVTFLFDRAERFISSSPAKKNQTEGTTSTRKTRAAQKKTRIFATFAPFAPFTLKPPALKDSRELERYHPNYRYSLLLWGIDLFIVAFALVRAVVLLPIISGHSLFLSYAMLTMRSKLAKITALVVLVQVAYLKIFIWHDATLLGGMLIGCLAALLYRQIDLVRMRKERGNSRI